ncbi:MAG TPA: hypothetical protein VFB80_17085, partial [Pirellulaceae bacterium]|nr:hypothetical protein [Pirellulaceae bacterium]
MQRVIAIFIALSLAADLPAGEPPGPWKLLPIRLWSQPARPAQNAKPKTAVAPASYQETLPPPNAPLPLMEPFPLPPGTPAAEELYRQTADDALRKSWGCVNCHQGVQDMHDLPTVKLGCIDCHGGNPDASTKEAAHVHPCQPYGWPSSANPVRSYTLLNHESPEFIRFVNPGDLRVAHISCGACHPKEVLEVKKSMMTHGCMLWGSALYNNGAVPNKAARYGESYSMCGVPQRVQTIWKAGDIELMQYEVARKAVVPFLDPLPRFEITQPGNVLRIFEQGGRFRPEVGIPERLEEPGRPRTRLSNRGLGTENRTDPVFIGLQKTRLLDPTLNFLGTNDKPGDYRSSGCSACHVVYANDRSPVHSGPYAKYGHMGLAAAEPDGQFVKNVDPTIPKHESGHPIAHRFSVGMPTSQCIVCHMHPGTNVVNAYLGTMWWDNETDGELMYPPQEKLPTSEQLAESLAFNPDETAARGNWSDPQFLANLTDLNSVTRHTQFADFHGHGWAFRAVFKKDRAGHLLDWQGRRVAAVTNDKLREAVRPPTEDEKTVGKQRVGTPVHLMDIHLEKGMHCVDCHFQQDNHGNTKLYGEVRAAIEIQCIDCHGTAGETAPERIERTGRLATSGPAAPPGGTNLLTLRTPHTPRQARFELQPDAPTSDGKPRYKLIQRSMVEPDRKWEVKQTAYTIRPDHPDYNEKSHAAKTVRWDAAGELLWGGQPDPQEEIGGRKCAHQSNTISCIACHSSWNPSCFGCHLPQKANQKTPSLHNEGDVSRNLVRYNFQTLRDDVFMLARDGLATGNRIGPARSSCAVHVSSYNANRENVYHQQQTISGCGLSGIAFSTNVPHTVRGGSRSLLNPAPGTSETKSCSDCHPSKNNDNNALLAQLLMQGTNYTNFMGKYCWVAAGEHGLEAVVVTEQDEPQAVIGSTLHRVAYPERHRHHLERGGELEHAHEHPGVDILDQLRHPLQKPEILQVQARGEFLYAACGSGGFRVFDMAFIDHKGFSERITTAPVSPLGQQLYVPTKYATAVAAPTTLAPDPTRQQLPENREQSVHALYAYIYVADKYEGLILVNAATLLDGNPLNNFLSRSLTYNPGGLLAGARHITIAGTFAYVSCDAGLVVIALDDPVNPYVTAVIDAETLPQAGVSQVQFRYAFVCAADGLHVLDVTDLAQPKPAGHLPLADCRSVYVARTYAYIAAGHQGLVIADITRPDRPAIDQIFDAGGCIDDLHDVKLGITYTSQFAYLADGQNGLRVVQLTSPDTPGNSGFSPRPTPQLVATRKLPRGGHALFVSEALDRDRAVDESGNQIAVFGRIGARPLLREEQQRMYLRPATDGKGPRRPWWVSDNVFDRE